MRRYLAKWHMTNATQKRTETGAASFLEAGFKGWSCLLAAAGAVLLVFCLVFSLVNMSLETYTLSMGGAAFAFSGTCWLLGWLARPAAVQEEPNRES